MQIRGLQRFEVRYQPERESLSCIGGSRRRVPNLVRARGRFTSGRRKLRRGDGDA